MTPNDKKFILLFVSLIVVICSGLLLVATLLK